MEKTIDFTRPIKDICEEYPEVIAIMRDLGFESITNPAMMKTVGRIMTIAKGASMRKIDLEKIKERFIKEGFTIKE